MTDKTKVKTPMEKLTHGYNEFIKGKELHKDGKAQFDKVVKKATKTKK